MPYFDPYPICSSDYRTEVAAIRSAAYESQWRQDSVAAGFFAENAREWPLTA